MRLQIALDLLRVKSISGARLHVVENIFVAQAAVALDVDFFDETLLL